MIALNFHFSFHIKCYDWYVFLSTPLCGSLVAYVTKSMLFFYYSAFRSLFQQSDSLTGYKPQYHNCIASISLKLFFYFVLFSFAFVVKEKKRTVAWKTKKKKTNGLSLTDYMFIPILCCYCFVSILNENFSLDVVFTFCVHCYLCEISICNETTMFYLILSLSCCNKNQLFLFALVLLCLFFCCIFWVTITYSCEGEIIINCGIMEMVFFRSLVPSFVRLGFIIFHISLL